jgi:hypothetical protein
MSDTRNPYTSIEALLTPQNGEMQVLGSKAKAASMSICKPSSKPTCVTVVNPYAQTKRNIRA